MKFICTLAALAVAAAPAFADDSSAALGAGGIVLTKQADIRMAAEDLRLSPKEARVRYEFVNDGKSDIDTIVAFPMPDIDVREFYFEPLGTTLDHAPNFMGFVLTLDGKRIEATPEERAMLDGKDVTAEVKAAGLPVNIVGGALVKKLDAMPPAQRKTLAAKGLIEIDGENEIHPHWIAQTKFWWKQHFPAGKTVVIEHRYQPVTGQSFFGDEELKDSKGGTTYRRDYCIDDATAAAVRTKTAKLDKNGPNGLYLTAYRTDFVLKTANNWKGPIGHFRLVLDKLKPDNVVSLCWNGLKKTGATTFEASRENFAPASDVKLLVLETPSAQ